MSKITIDAFRYFQEENWNMFRYDDPDDID